MIIHFLLRFMLCTRWINSGPSESVVTEQGGGNVKVTVIGGSTVHCIHPGRRKNCVDVSFVTVSWSLSV